MNSSQNFRQFNAHYYEKEALRKINQICLILMSIVLFLIWLNTNPFLRYFGFIDEMVLLIALIKQNSFGFSQVKAKEDDDQ